MSIYSICIIHKTIRLFNQNIGDFIMKKIQVSTVRQIADVEVLFVNASLIAKALRAQMAASKIAKHMEDNRNVYPVMEPEVDQEGNPIVDENGYVKEHPMLDEKGNQVWYYGNHRLDAIDVEDFYKNVAPFLKELVDAFEE